MAAGAATFFLRAVGVSVGSCWAFSAGFDGIFSVSSASLACLVAAGVATFFLRAADGSAGSFWAFSAGFDGIFSVSSASLACLVAAGVATFFCAAVCGALGPSWAFSAGFSWVWLVSLVSLGASGVETLVLGAACDALDWSLVSCTGSGWALSSALVSLVASGAETLVLGPAGCWFGSAWRFSVAFGWTCSVTLFCLVGSGAEALFLGAICSWFGSSLAFPISFDEACSGAFFVGAVCGSFDSLFASCETVGFSWTGSASLASCSGVLCFFLSGAWFGSFDWALASSTGLERVASVILESSASGAVAIPDFFCVRALGWFGSLGSMVIGLVLSFVADCGVWGPATFLGSFWTAGLVGWAGIVSEAWDSFWGTCSFSSLESSVSGGDFLTVFTCGLLGLACWELLSS